MFETLKDDINGIVERDPAARSALEVLICYPGVHAVLMHRVAHNLWRRDWVNNLSLDFAACAMANRH